jgi:hypothetical protein
MMEMPDIVSTQQAFAVLLVINCSITAVQRIGRHRL